jgi:hypothetical protein
MVLPNASNHPRLTEESTKRLVIFKLETTLEILVGTMLRIETANLIVFVFVFVNRWSRVGECGLRAILVRRDCFGSRSAGLLRFGAVSPGCRRMSRVLKG